MQNDWCSDDVIHKSTTVVRHYDATHAGCWSAYVGTFYKARMLKNSSEGASLISDASVIPDW